MSRVRTVFLGSPPFAAQILERLLQDEHLEIVGVVSQPDRPRGRGQKLQPTAVKSLALEQGLNCISPEKINTQEALAQLAAWQAEVAIVVAFGQILSERFMQLFHYGAVNIHASLLPKWRGAAPIQRSIEAGEYLMGVTLQKIVKELDAGDIIGQRQWNIDWNTDALQVLEQCVEPSVQLLQVDLMDYIRGNLSPKPQDHSQATYAHKITKEETRIDWNQSAWDIHNKVRAFIMGPGCYCITNRQERLKILRTRWIPSSYALDSFCPEDAPGTVKKIAQNIIIKCGPYTHPCRKDSDKGLIEPINYSLLELVEVQPENKKPSTALDWFNGLHESNLKLH